MTATNTIILRACCPHSVFFFVCAHQCLFLKLIPQRIEWLWQFFLSASLILRSRPERITLKISQLFRKAWWRLHSSFFFFPGLDDNIHGSCHPPTSSSLWCQINNKPQRVSVHTAAVVKTLLKQEACAAFLVSAHKHLTSSLLRLWTRALTKPTWLMLVKLWKCS